MRTIAKTVCTLAVAALSATALEKEFIDQMMQSARNIERDSLAVSQALKPSKPDADDVRKKIEAMSADVAKLQEMVTQFESTHPSLSDRDLADWKLVKEKVQLLEIFHNQKKTLAGEDVAKHRSLLRAHANGLARRALKLQESAGRLRRGAVS